MFTITKHPLQVGSILESVHSDGDLRFVRFFKVKDLVGEWGVELVELERSPISGEFSMIERLGRKCFDGWKGTVSPSDWELDLPPQLYMANSSGQVRISDLWVAAPWGGEPLYFNSLNS